MTAVETVWVDYEALMHERELAVCRLPLRWSPLRGSQRYRPDPRAPLD